MSTPPFVVALPVAPAQRRGVLGPVLGFVVLGIAGLAAVGLVGTEVGVVGVVVGALCALLPVGPVVAVFLWIDRWEPEPPRMLLAAFGWGAGVAALVAIVLNSGAVLAVEALLGRGQGDVVGSVISAPLVEEFVKGAFLVGLVVRRRREFDGVVDGIVYAGITAAGFAFTENILYFGRAFLEVGSVPAAAVATTFVLRGLLSPFAHPLFTAMIGIGTGVAASIRSRGLGALAILAGYALAVVLHALWNAATQLGPGFFGVYLLIMLPMFGAVAGLALWQRRRERDLLTRQMPGFAAAGWIAGSEVALLSSMSGRRRWAVAVRRRAGRPRRRGLPTRRHRARVPARPRRHRSPRGPTRVARRAARRRPADPPRRGEGAGRSSPAAPVKPITRPELATPTRLPW